MIDPEETEETIDDLDLDLDDYCLGTLADQEVPTHERINVRSD